ncbi:MAG: NrdJb [Pseudomonadales bacterium]
MATKIEKKIVGYKVINEEEKARQQAEAAAAAEEQRQSNIIQMHESVERPEMLIGSTYKIKTPDSEHAMYITINDIVLNEGTDHEQRRPFEVFINSKNMDHFQWIVALTRITSAVFRKGGDVTFLVEEMQAVFDPKGGYFKKGGRYMPSLVAEIGGVIEDHLKKIGMIVDESMHEEQKAILAQKRAEYEAAQKSTTADAAEEAGENQYPPGATVCKKCSTKAVIMMDGCMTCLSCGDSKCG